MQEFEKSVRQDGRVNLQLEGELDWFLLVRYTYDKIIDASESWFSMENVNACKMPKNPGSDLDSLPVLDTPD